MLSLQDQSSHVTGSSSRRRRNSARRCLSATPPALPPSPPRRIATGTPDDEPPTRRSPEIAALHARVVAAIECREAFRASETRDVWRRRIVAMEEERERLDSLVETGLATEDNFAGVRESLARSSMANAERARLEEELRSAITAYSAAMSNAELDDWDGTSPLPRDPEAFAYGGVLWIVPPGANHGQHVMRVDLAGWLGRMVVGSLAGVEP